MTENILISYGRSVDIFILKGAMKDHIQALKQGYLTLLPMCDEAGEAIIYLNKNLKSNPSTDEVRFGLIVLFSDR